MMRAQSHRGNDAFGVATFDKLEISRQIDDLRFLDLDSSVSIGYNLMQILPADIPQPVQLSEGAIAFDGEVYSNKSVLGVSDILRNINESAADVPSTLVRSEDGAFSVSVVADGEIFLARDPLGLKPLYYGESDEFYAAASEKKALWNIGIGSPNSLPPGHVATMTNKSVALNPVRTISRSVKTTNDSIVQEVHDHIVDSINARTSDIDDVAIAFSGGLDSGLVAHIAKLLGKNVTAVSVSIHGSRDLVQAEEGARQLKIPMIQKSFKKEDVENAVKQVLWNMEDTNPMKVEVAIAMRWVAEIASEHCFKVILTGQGGDELFAGYAKYARILGSQGPKQAKEAVIQSIADAPATNYTRDEQVFAPYRLRLRHPFADWKLTQIALSIPIESNIRTASDQLRKRILREAARIAHLPSSMVEAPKRAVQFGSGIHRALSEIAKKKKMSVRQFVEKSYDELVFDLPSIH
jgi:asparagine synthase (glutamine-hydrolysing)